MAKAKKQPAKKQPAKKQPAKQKLAKKKLAKKKQKLAKKKAKPKPKAKKLATAKPAKSEPPTDIAARLGRKSAESMQLDGENPAPDDTTLQEWAYDWFLNAGGFDAIKGSDDNNAAEQAAIKQSFFDAFKTAIRTRLNLAQPNALG